MTGLRILLVEEHQGVREVLATRLLEEFRTVRSGLPIVVISGSSRPREFRGEWVLKPAPMDELLPAIRAAAVRGLLEAG